MLRPVKKVYFSGALIGMSEIRNILPELDHNFSALWDDVANVIVLKPKAKNTRGTWRIPMSNVSCFQLAPTASSGKFPGKAGDEPDDE